MVLAVGSATELKCFLEIWGRTTSMRRPRQTERQALAVDAWNLLRGLQFHRNKGAPCLFDRHTSWAPMQVVIFMLVASSNDSWRLLCHTCVFQKKDALQTKKEST